MGGDLKKHLKWGETEKRRMSRMHHYPRYHCGPLEFNPFGKFRELVYEADLNVILPKGWRAGIVTSKHPSVIGGLLGGGEETSIPCTSRPSPYKDRAGYSS